MSLPKYAQGVARDELVNYLCKGGCRGTVRWMRLNIAEPSLDVINKAEMGVFKATCLMCGSVMKDNYNWGR